MVAILGRYGSAPSEFPHLEVTPGACLPCLCTLAFIGIANLPQGCTHLLSPRRTEPFLRVTACARSILWRSSSLSSSWCEYHPHIFAKEIRRSGISLPLLHFFTAILRVVSCFLASLLLWLATIWH
ncbi:hypothetical protein VTN96DRAFT_7172 [Rasamsonia emersonii]